jgi:hypothetical protein
VPVFEFWSSVPALPGSPPLAHCAIGELQLKSSNASRIHPGEGTGIYLLGNAVRALDTLEVGDQVAQRGIHIRRQRTADHRGRALFEVDVTSCGTASDPVWRCPGRTCIERCSPELRACLTVGTESAGLVHSRPRRREQGFMRNFRGLRDEAAE